MCAQGHQYIHREVQIKEHDARKHGKRMAFSVWKSNGNASTGGIAMLLNPHTYKALSLIQSASTRFLVATFNGNPQATIICCYSPTNVPEKTEMKTFHDELCSITRKKK